MDEDKFAYQQHLELDSDLESDNENPLFPENIFNILNAEPIKIDPSNIVKVPTPTPVNYWTNKPVQQNNDQQILVVNKSDNMKDLKQTATPVNYGTNKPVQQNIEQQIVNMKDLVQTTTPLNSKKPVQQNNGQQVDNKPVVNMEVMPVDSIPKSKKKKKKKSKKNKAHLKNSISAVSLATNLALHDGIPIQIESDKEKCTSTKSTKSVIVDSESMCSLETNVETNDPNKAMKNFIKGLARYGSRMSYEDFIKAKSLEKDDEFDIDYRQLDIENVLKVQSDENIKILNQIEKFSTVKKKTKKRKTMAAVLMNLPLPPSQKLSDHLAYLSNKLNDKTDTEFDENQISSSSVTVIKGNEVKTSKKDIDELKDSVVEQNATTLELSKVDVNQRNKVKTPKENINELKDDVVEQNETTLELSKVDLNQRNEVKTPKENINELKDDVVVEQTETTLELSKVDVNQINEVKTPKENINELKDDVVEQTETTLELSKVDVNQINEVKTPKENINELKDYVVEQTETTLELSKVDVNQRNEVKTPKENINELKDDVEENATTLELSKVNVNKNITNEVIIINNNVLLKQECNYDNVRCPILEVEVPKNVMENILQFSPSIPENVKKDELFGTNKSVTKANIYIKIFDETDSEVNPDSNILIKNQSDKKMSLCDNYSQTDIIGVDCKEEKTVEITESLFDKCIFLLFIYIFIHMLKLFVMDNLWHIYICKVVSIILFFFGMYKNVD